MVRAENVRKLITKPSTLIDASGEKEEAKTQPELERKDTQNIRSRGLSENLWEDQYQW